MSRKDTTNIKARLITKTARVTQIGLRTSFSYRKDPRRLLFMLARYKFVAKMLSGKKKVLEIGCGDAFGTRLVQQEVSHIYAIDSDPAIVKDVNRRMEKRWRFDCRVHNILRSAVDGLFDAAYALDVLEHIPKKDESRLIVNIIQSLEETGVLIIGTPSIQSKIYASHESKGLHVNYMDQKRLHDLMSNYFHNVFMFSMNDEVVHTGFCGMAHYLFAIGVQKRKGNFKKLGSE